MPRTRGCAGVERDRQLPSAHERLAGHGPGDRVRGLRARAPDGERDAHLLAGGQRLRRGRRRARGGRGGTSRRRTRCATRAGSTSRATCADSSQLTDEDVGLANVILTNGARLYVDHAHPEYSSPECTNPRDLVAWDKAGELVMARRGGAGRAHAGRPADQPLQEQHRQQGRLLRHPRELPDAAGDAVRRHRPPPHAVLRQPPGRHRRRAGSASGRTAAARASRSASARTSSRSRSAWRPR